MQSVCAAENTCFDGVSLININNNNSSTDLSLCRTNSVGQSSYKPPFLPVVVCRSAALMKDSRLLFPSKGLMVITGKSTALGYTNKFFYCIVVAPPLVQTDSASVLNCPSIIKTAWAECGQTFYPHAAPKCVSTAGL